MKRVRAAKEVIISAGAVGSPHILLNSGIGDTHTLSRFGIKPLVHLPSVGQNLSDHPFLGNTWTVNSDDTFETLTRNDTLEGEELKQWMEFRRGPLAEGTFNHAGWLRLPQNSSIFKQSPDPSAGPHTAHIEFVISVCFGPSFATTHAHEVDMCRMVFRACLHRLQEISLRLARLFFPLLLVS